MIQEQLDTTLGQYSLGLENLTKEAEEQKNIQAKIASRKQEIQQLRTYQRGLYEGLIQNHLSKDEYFSFKEKYEAKIEAISEEIEQLKAGLAILLPSRALRIIFHSSCCSSALHFYFCSLFWKRPHQDQGVSSRDQYQRGDMQQLHLRGKARTAFADCSFG